MPKLERKNTRDERAFTPVIPTPRPPFVPEPVPARVVVPIEMLKIGVEYCFTKSDIPNTIYKGTLERIDRFDEVINIWTGETAPTSIFLFRLPLHVSEDNGLSFPPITEEQLTNIRRNHDTAVHPQGDGNSLLSLTAVHKFTFWISNMDIVRRNAAVRIPLDVVNAGIARSSHPHMGTTEEQFAVVRTLNELLGNDMRQAPLVRPGEQPQQPDPRPIRYFAPQANAMFTEPQSNPPVPSTWPDGSVVGSYPLHGEFGGKLKRISKRISKRKSKRTTKRIPKRKTKRKSKRKSNKK
jgi:hypothetical protein